MARPIIFLDFDGVLNSLCSVLVTGRGGAVCPDANAVGLMCRLAREANANVVVSSAWRVGATLVSLRETLTRWSASELAKRLIGKTPTGGECRGAEIAQWLAENPSRHDGRWVIVDDDGDMLDGQLPQFVQTRHRDGFTVREYVRAIRIIAPEHQDSTGLAWYADDRPLSSEARNPDRRKLEWEA